MSVRNVVTILGSEKVPTLLRTENHRYVSVLLKIDPITNVVESLLVVYCSQVPS